VVIYQNNKAAEPLRKTTEHLLLLLRTAGQLNKAAGQLMMAGRQLRRA
jgi:hypothetical protein